MKRVPVFLAYIVALLFTLLISGFDCDTNDPEEEDPPTSRAWASLTPEVIDFGPVTVGLTDTALIHSNRESRYGDTLPYAYNVAVTRSYPDFYLLSVAGAESLVTDTLTVADPADEFPVVFAPLVRGIYSSAVKTRSAVVAKTDTVHLDGIGVEGCSFSRNRIDFGDVDLGTSRRDTFTVRNITYPPGAHDVTVRVEIVGCEYLRFVFNGSAAFEWREWTLAPGEAVVCTLQFSPPGTSDYSCTLETGDESYCGPIFVTGTGTGSALGDWSSCSTNTNSDLYGVHESFDGQRVAVGDSGVVLGYGPLGPRCDWNPLPTPGLDTLSFRGVWVVSGADIWIAGSEIGDAWGGAHVFERVVGAWEQQDSVVTIEHYNCGWASSVNDIYFFGLGAVSDHNGRHFDGSAWENVLVDWGMAEVTGVWGSGPNDVWAVLNQSNYSLWHSDGTTWEDRTEAWMDENLQDVWVDASGVAFVVGNNGAIYYYDGSTWYDQSVGGTETLYGVSGRSPSDVHVVGADAALYHYDGFTWRAYAAPAGINVDLRDVWVNHHGEAWAVGQKGTILYHPGP